MNTQAQSTKLLCMHDGEKEKENGKDEGGGGRTLITICVRK